MKIPVKPDRPIARVPLNNCIFSVFSDRTLSKQRLFAEMNGHLPNTQKTKEAATTNGAGDDNALIPMRIQGMDESLKRSQIWLNKQKANLAHSVPTPLNPAGDSGDQSVHLPAPSAAPSSLPTSVKSPAISRPIPAVRPIEGNAELGKGR